MSAAHDGLTARLRDSVIVECAEAADAIEQLSAHSIGDRFAHRLAILLECALLDPTGTWNDGLKLLDEYRAAHEAEYPSMPTFMGEPMPPERKARLMEMKAQREALK